MLILANGGKNVALGLIKDANLRIGDNKVPINIHVRESTEESLLIEGSWFKRYKADLLLSKNKLTFKANERDCEIKIYEKNPKQVSINILTLPENPPPPYQPTIE